MSTHRQRKVDCSQTSHIKFAILENCWLASRCSPPRKRVSWERHQNHDFLTHSANSRHIFHRRSRLDNAVQLRRDLQLRHRSDPRFLSYLTARWLYITRKWAMFSGSQRNYSTAVSQCLTTTTNSVERQLDERDEDDFM
ncbi:hypothetical protein T265_04297 [Opisthorchis viverrini]|uniref:Uncharacterized protein n=1 Tax=Opisthorchis viverrini TaxID=6198 RepID=A0A074ZPF4_OPIVI|nr:hypothetical protein T265_04297 [Opisthorchis viverrini]KER29006.1 hypothetical protein T265_04297 [Opisthorchis viverrini]